MNLEAKLVLEAAQAGLDSAVGRITVASLTQSNIGKEALALVEKLSPSASQGLEQFLPKLEVSDPTNVNKLPNIDELIEKVRAGIGKSSGDTENLRQRLRDNYASEENPQSPPDLAVQSTSPPIFRVLSGSGHSPDMSGAGIKWSLPERDHQGWKPGRWQQGFPDSSDPAPFPGTNNYWVSDNLHWFNARSRVQPRLFEAQIGDSKSLELWHAAPKDRWNFPVKQLRLIREFSPDEIDTLNEAFKTFEWKSKN